MSVCIPLPPVCSPSPASLSSLPLLPTPRQPPNAFSAASDCCFLPQRTRLPFYRLHAQQGKQTKEGDFSSCYTGGSQSQVRGGDQEDVGAFCFPSSSCTLWSFLSEMGMGEWVWVAVCMAGLIFLIHPQAESCSSPLEVSEGGTWFVPGWW